MLSKFNNNKQSLIPFVGVYLILVIGFFFNLDPNGGAYLDYINQKRISQEFSENFINEFLNFDKTSTRHSPVLLIILSFFEKIELADVYIRLLNFHFCILLPIFFYKIISLKYNFLTKKIKILISSLIFLSPTYISLSIWPDSRIYGLIFFCLAIINYLNFTDKKKYSYAIKCIAWYALATYFSLNFALFSIFFMFKFFKFYKFDLNFFYLIIFNLILAFPALLYTFTLDSIFFFKSGVAGKDFDLTDSFNFSNKILIISSIIFFYLIPFYLSNLIKFNFKNVNNIFIGVIIFLICISFFNYEKNLSGGGIFFKISNYIFENNIFFYFVSLTSLIILIDLIKNNFDNFLIIFLLMTSNIQFSIYHKYYDPLLFILFFSILDIRINELKIKNIKISYFYLFSFTFLILNFIKQLI